MQNYEVKNTLKIYKEEFEKIGFIVNVDCGGDLKIYKKSNYVQENEFLRGLVINVSEVYRHNGTNENKTAEFKFIKWTGQTGSVLKEKIRCAFDASDKVRNSRIEKVVRIYTENA